METSMKIQIANKSSSFPLLFFRLYILCGPATSTILPLLVFFRGLNVGFKPRTSALSHFYTKRMVEDFELYSGIHNIYSYVCVVNSLCGLMRRVVTLVLDQRIKLFAFVSVQQYVWFFLAIYWVCIHVGIYIYCLRFMALCIRRNAAENELTNLFKRKKA